MNELAPIYVRTFANGKVTVAAYGGPFNWNFAGASREEMEAKNPGISQALLGVMEAAGIKRALVPKPAFNAQVVTKDDLGFEIIPNFYRGADADGVIITEPGDAYFLASADCLATALFDHRSGTLAALHCGRDALIDRKLINEGYKAAREQASVIDTAVQRLQKCLPQMVGNIEEVLTAAFDMSKLTAYLMAGIRPKTFDHPTIDNPYAEANNRMIDHLIKFETMSDTPRRGYPTRRFPPVVTDSVLGKIDLFSLVRRQLAEQRVTNVHEDEFDTATSKAPNGDFLFHSNRRDKVKRNLVIIKLN